MASTSTSKTQPIVTPLETARARLIFWGVLMLVVYIVYLIFFPLVPYINRPGPALDIEMILRNGMQWFAPFYILGLGILFYAFWRMLKIVHELSGRDPASANSLRHWVLGIGIVCGVVLLGLYPITALDVALYVVRARLWALYGVSPLIALPQNFPQDPYIALAGEFAKEASPYGPVWELLAQLPLRMGIVDIAGGILAMKVISLISYVGMAILIGWHSRQETEHFGVSGATAMTFFALNPLVLLEAIGNGHNDMLMLTLMMLGLILWQRGRWAWAALALTVAALVKATGFILIPLFGMAVIVSALKWRDRILRTLAISAIVLITATVLYRALGPFPDVFQGAEHALFNRRGYVPSYFFYVILHNAFPGKRDLALFPFKLAPALFVLYYVFLLIQLARRKMSLMEAGFAAFFSQILLGATFRIWYPLWLIPFAALNLNSRTFWQTFLFSITAELSILSYYILWRWVWHSWSWGLNGPLKKYWEYWTVMTVFTAPLTFGIPWLGTLLRKWKDRQRFANSLWI